MAKTGWPNDVQDGIVDYAVQDEEAKSDVLNITVASAPLFVLFASGFLVFIYKFMSGWFILLLVILFSIGGFEVSNHFTLSCISELISAKLSNYQSGSMQSFEQGLQACSVAVLSRLVLLFFKLYWMIEFDSPVQMNGNVTSLQVVHPCQWCLCECTIFRHSLAADPDCITFLYNLCHSLGSLSPCIICMGGPRYSGVHFLS